jgi:hypothetical protein
MDKTFYYVIWFSIESASAVSKGIFQEQFLYYLTTANTKLNKYNKISLRNVNEISVLQLGL